MSGATTAPASPGVASFPPVLRHNPYQRLLYEHLGEHGLRFAGDGELKLSWLLHRRRTVAVLHFHWPQNYYYWLGRPRWARVPMSWLRVGLLAIRLAFARLIGYRVVWTVHQLRPHESLDRRLDRVAAWLLSRASNALLAHDGSTARQTEETLRLAPGSVVVLPHGSYLGVYPPGRDRDAVRRELGLPDDAFVFLSFGHLRGYKETAALLDAFSALDEPSIRLVVAGLPLDEGSRECALLAAEADARIRVVLEFVPDAGVAELFGACDVCVFARRDGGTSGALVLALSLGIPVVAADVDAYHDLLGGGEAGWLFDVRDREALAATLRLAAGDRHLVEAKANAGRRIAAELAWPRLAPRYAAAIGGVDPGSRGL